VMEDKIQLPPVHWWWWWSFCQPAFFPGEELNCALKLLTDSN
jgi:hypothetical protein